MERLIKDVELASKESNTLIKGKSHNDNHALCDNTNLLIVGTITPEDSKYFYCSAYNRLYGYIDKASEGQTDLREHKKGLSTPRWNAKDKTVLTDPHEIDKKVGKIISELKRVHIAFLDVMDSVLRKKENVNSHKDDDIEYFSLAYDAFKDVDPDKLTIIANSDLAYNCLLKIFAYHNKNAKNIKPLSQRWDSRDEWVKFIKEAIKKPKHPSRRKHIFIK